jgi:glycosyltransferase involved in cell wall biosynthesis
VAGELVSVVIPTYNCARYLPEALASVLRQPHRPIEVIVVDDGSTDDTATLVAGFAAPVRSIRIPHSGIAAARNTGVDAARGEFLALLDADDVWSDDKLTLQLAALRSDAGLDIVFGHVVEFVSGALPADRGAAGTRQDGPRPGLIPGATLIRRSAFDRVGLFNPAFRVGEFIDWYARAREAGLMTAMLPAVVLHRRLHDTNTGITQRHHRGDYAAVVKAALDRRRRS